MTLTDEQRARINAAADLFDDDLYIPDRPGDKARDFFRAQWLDDVRWVPSDYRDEFIASLADEARALNKMIREADWRKRPSAS